MVNCSIRYCKNKSTKGGSISFMSFPKDPTVVMKWLKHCKLNTNTKNSRVCSVHFDASDYQRTMRQIIMNEYPKRCRQIKPDAVPSLYLNTALEIQLTEEGSENITYVEPDIFMSDNNLNCPEVEVTTSNHQKEEQTIKRAREPSVEPPETNGTDAVIVPVKKYKELLKFKSKYENIEKKLLKIFTPGQISHLHSSDANHVRWTAEDIAPAITLRSITPNGYRYLRQVVGIPYPGCSTLSKWVRKFDVEEGVLDKVISLMELKTKEFDSKQKIVTLSFDEIYIWNRRETEKNNTSRAYSTCLCVMVRSLYGKWKQLIYYKFDQNMTTDTLKNLIRRLYNINLIVCAVTCDQGRSNPDLLTSLNIGPKSPENTWFPHPSDENLRIHVFIDIPHLLKLARNNFVEHGFLYEDKLLTKETIVKFLGYLTENDLKLTNKLTINHLNVQGPMKTRTAPAAELFSNATSIALEWCGNHGFVEDENLYEVSQVLKIFSEWFDVFNVQILSEENKNAFGINLEHQREVLETMNSLISSIKTGKKKNKLRFQKGILISNKSLCNLFDDLQDMLGSDFECFLTSRLNLDLLKNFFSHIRGMSFVNDNVTGLSLKHRIKQYIIGKHSAESIKSSTSTYEDPDVPCLVKPLEIMENVEKT